MNEDLHRKTAEFSELLVEAIDALDAALEDKIRERILFAHEKLSQLVTQFQTLLEEAGDERPQVEKRFERRVTDLKRQAARLPGGGTGRPAKLAVDAGSVPFILQRAPGKSLQDQFDEPARRGEKPKYTTGGEVEAWCGPCGDMKTHNIYALVEGLPTIVICQACGGRHNFRAEPGRKRGTALPEGPERPFSVGPQRPSREQAEVERKLKEKAALKEELAGATEVRAYSPRERYKAGEIIEHAELGRGKIETVTKRSLLVRFAVGLRPLELQ